jgi:hypothetical protein
MNSRKTTKFFFLTIIILFLLPFPFSNQAEAAPSSCNNPYSNNLGHTITGITPDYITIQCNAKDIWINIRSQATFSNVRGNYYNYSNTGGYSRAYAHFESMPGKVEKTSNGNLKKTTSDGTLTLYKATETNGNPWTLQFPRGGGYYDKIRYYDGSGPTPLPNAIPREV